MNEEKNEKLKEVELRIVAELMKNSRRSDRELAKALHVSQPTVSRTIKRLEKEGIIKEYTIIPDFAKLGYSIMGISQIHVDQTREEYLKQTREKAAKEYETEKVHANVLVVTGTDHDTNRAFLTFYKDYADYAEDMRMVKTVSFSQADKIKTFLADLNHELHYRPLTMSEVARRILFDVERANEGVRK